MCSMEKRAYKVGSKIVEGGRVHRIFRSAKRKNKDGEMVQTIFFKPFFKIDSDNFLTSSIPLSNVVEANIRKAVSKAELSEIMSSLEKKIKEEIIDLDILKEKIIINEAKSTAQVIKSLWVDKNNIATSFSPSKKSIYKKAMRSFSEEYALVRNTTVEKAENKIIDILEKSI